MAMVKRLSRDEWQEGNQTPPVTLQSLIYVGIVGLPSRKTLIASTLAICPEPRAGDPSVSDNVYKGFTMPLIQEQ